MCPKLGHAVLSHLAKVLPWQKYSFYYSIRCLFINFVQYAVFINFVQYALFINFVQYAVFINFVQYAVFINFVQTAVRCVLLFSAMITSSR